MVSKKRGKGLRTGRISTFREDISSWNLDKCRNVRRIFLGAVSFPYAREFQASVADIRAVKYQLQQILTGSGADLDTATTHETGTPSGEE